MRSRLAVSAVTTVLATLALVFGLGGTAQADTRPPVTDAECRATGGAVFPIGLAGAVCLWQGPTGWADGDSASITDIRP